MSYLTQATIADDGAMRRRAAVCAAEQQSAGRTVIGDPTEWARARRLTWASAPSWDSAWESYLVGTPQPPWADPETDPDGAAAYEAWVPPGEHPGVISDGMILAQVQAMTEAGDE